MMSKVTNGLLMDPVVLHARLHTTFTGVVHPISTQEAPVHQYLGIKYASVPARFRQSKLCTSYPSATDATQYGPICPQPGSKTYEQEVFNLPDDCVPREALKQSEFDCLNLNITCPAIALPSSGYPVMIFIHGGGHRGSGSSWLYDGGAFVQRSILAGKPVILVTVNYRLGLLASAASPALREDNKLAGDEGVGNYGLRDQRKALEWVHSFISDFGGDAGNITLFGIGTGATDVLCHIHSAANVTAPLFQRSIVQSPVLELDIPSVASAGWQFNKLMSSFQAHNMDDLRSVPLEKLVLYTPHVRAVDDGHFFAKGWREALYPEQQAPLHDHHSIPELQMYTHHPKSRNSRTSVRSTSSSRSRSRARHIHNNNLYHHNSHLQPMMIGDCGAESLLWAAPVSNWSATGVVRRLRAICQSLSKSSALLRAYDISSHTPADELPDRVLELINDARFAWPTDCLAATAKRARGGQGVWRYVFDQESPSRGTPHHAVDLLYLFDNVPLSVASSISPPASYSPDISPACSLTASPSISPPSTPPLSYGSDSDSEGVDFGFGFTTDDDWGAPIVDEWSYARVRDAIQGRWLAFAYGEAPWSEEKVYVFGPEGETGERSMNIFAGRRRLNMWKEALEPLGMHLAQKVGVELCNGPPLS